MWVGVFVGGRGVRAWTAVNGGVDVCVWVDDEVDEEEGEEYDGNACNGDVSDLCWGEDWVVAS